MTKTLSDWDDRMLRYPDYDTPILQWYAGRYDTVFVAFHPFFRVTDPMAGPLDEYPCDTTIRLYGQKIRWQTIAEAVGLPTVAAVNHALAGEPQASQRLLPYLDSQRIWAPIESVFQAFIGADILEAFTLADESMMHAVNEFQTIMMVRESCHVLHDPAVGLVPILHPIGYRGTLFPPSKRLLVTVDWDSYFTLFCGPEALLHTLVDTREMEGFFCDQQTTHFWWR